MDHLAIYPFPATRYRCTSSKVIWCVPRLQYVRRDGTTVPSTVFINRSSRLLLWCSQQQYIVVADSVHVQSAVRPLYTSARKVATVESKTKDKTRHGKPPVPHLCRHDRSRNVW